VTAPPGPQPQNTDRPLRRFRQAYAAHRAREGRALSAGDLLQLPFLSHGPQAAQWRVRGRTFTCFVTRVLRPLARARAPRPLTLLDLGAGNAWLCYRVARLGARPLALDVRSDAVDGLAAAAAYLPLLALPFPRIAAGFEALPLAPGCADLAVFNASLHYALDLPEVLGEALRVLRPDGRIAVLDSPFYRSATDGDAMVREKHANRRQVFGDLADDLTALPFVEYLTRSRLEEASTGLGLVWRRHRPRYPLWYQLRPMIASLRGRRSPSRFDVWEAHRAGD